MSRRTNALGDRTTSEELNRNIPWLAEAAVSGGLNLVEMIEIPPHHYAALFERLAS
jgi:hypothetical protein